MEKAVIISLIAVLTAVAGVGYHLSNGNNLSVSVEITKYQAWEDWKNQFGKVYTYQEIPLKYSVFSANYDFIQTQNAKNLKYKVGLNEYADLTSQEFASYRMKQPIEGPNKHTTTVKETTVAASLNWASKGAVGAVNNQGQCGSCWAFSATEAIEGLNYITNKKYEQFSVQQVVDCSEYTGAAGCNGGYPQWAYEYVQTYGIQSLASYPYAGVTQTCAYNQADVEFKVGGYVNVTSNSPSQMKAAIQTQPLSICIEADSSAFQLYSSGIFDDASCGTTLDHCVLLSGYNTQGSTQYWIVQNSWGTSWGLNGYIWIENTSGDGICGMNTWVTYPTA